jgi:hypothetical protein
MAQKAGVDIDAIINANQRGPAGPKCRICVALELMPADVRAKVEQAMADRERFGNRNIGDIINAIGVRSSTGMPIQVGLNGVDRHRRGGCSTHKRPGRG